MPPDLSDHTAIAFKQENPKRSGTKAHERYDEYKGAKTVAEALRLGALKADVVDNIKQGHCLVLGAGGASVPAVPAAPPQARKRPAVEVQEGVGPPKLRHCDADSLGLPDEAKAAAPVLPQPVPAAALAAALAAPTQPTVAALSTQPSGGLRAATSSSVAQHPAEQEVDLSFAKLDGRPLKFMKRVMGEARRLLSSSGLSEAKVSGYEFRLTDRENLCRWAVKLQDLNPDGQLAKDLKRYQLDPSVDLEFTLPDGFPMEPPFVRVVYPQLSGGFVFSRGGICFEPLTAKGWAPSMTLPALAIAIKGILDYGDVRVAGAGDKATRTVPQYTEEGARKDHAHIIAAHRGGESTTYGSLKRYSS